MAAIDAMETARDAGFQERTKFFLKKGSVAIMSESLSTAGHTERVAYAKTVLNGSASIIEAAQAIVTDATIEGAGLGSTDAQIENAVNSMLNALAGYESGPA